jgi:hypothetical protein
MALTIENGSIVANADSYATVAELRAYALKRGETVPVDDASCEVLMIKAMDWLQAQEDRYLGTRVNSLQALAWPRSGVRRPNGWDYYPSDAIPPQLKQAQCALALDAKLQALQPTRQPDEQGPVTAEQVGSLSVSYAEPVNRISKAVYAVAEGHLVTLVRGAAGATRLVRA